MIPSFETAKLRFCKIGHSKLIVLDGVRIEIRITPKRKREGETKRERGGRRGVIEILIYDGN